MRKVASDQRKASQGAAELQAGDLDLTTRLVTALQSAAVGIIITDLNARVEFLNAEAQRLTGFANNADRASLQETLKLQTSTGNPLRDDLVNLALVSETPVALGKDVALITASGETRQIEGEICVCKVAGVPTGTVVTFRDVTARNSEQRQFQADQKLSAVSRLAGAVAHELNNLLTVVLGQSETLEGLYPNLPPLHVCTAEIRRVTAAIAIMTRQLVTLSRRDVLQPKALEVNSFIEELAPTFQQMLPSNVELRMDLGAGAGEIFADAAQMNQAITNLFQHCRNRLAGAGTITISTAKVVIDSNCYGQHLRHYVRLAVEDSGPSLRGRDVEDLFEPSWNADPSHPSGIGLFAVRNMIGAANGHFSIECDSPAGASFVMLFPVREAEPLATEEGSSTPRPKRTVLLVEDNDGIRILLRNAFERQGYMVIEARDGEEAMLQSELHAAPIDVLISDVVMPLMDGPTLARNLAEHRPDMKVILTSGCPIDPSAITELMATGARFVLKPFTQRDLVALAESILGATWDAQRPQE